jgi:hypothetical protein
MYAAPSYYVQLVSELESLKQAYSLEVPLHGHTSQSIGYKKAVELSRRQGIEFVRVSGRIISGDIMTRRSVIEARKRKF